MGCFDTVWVPCPRCGKKTGYQTKAGACALDHFDFADVPGHVWADIADTPNGKATICIGCGAHFKVFVKCIPTIIEVAADPKKPWE